MESTNSSESPTQQTQKADTEKKKETSLSSMFSQLEKKCNKEKRTMNTEELKKLDNRFKQEFVGCPFEGSQWVYGNINKKYKEPYVYFVDKRVSGGLLKIKKKQPTVKQIIKQLCKTYTADMLTSDNVMNELKILYSNDNLILLGTEWGQRE